MCKPLTPKQALFVTEYLVRGCGTDAYRAAYQAQDMSDGAIQVEASRLLGNPKVAAAIGEHRAALAKKARHSLQDCVADQERAMELKALLGVAIAPEGSPGKGSVEAGDGRPPQETHTTEDPARGEHEGV